MNRTSWMRKALARLPLSFRLHYLSSLCRASSLPTSGRRSALALEKLEERTCLSAAYTYDVIAKTGSQQLTGFAGAPSINDAGKVAFVGQLSNGQGIFVGSGTSSSLHDINPAFGQTPTRTFSGFVQINNKDQVAAIDRVSGALPQSLARIWNADALNSFTILARAGIKTPPVNDPFDAILAAPTINNNGDVVFPALNGSSVPLELHKAGAAMNVVKTLTKLNAPEALRPMISDNGMVVVRAGNNANSPIVLYSPSGTATTIASSSQFKALGSSPGISEDGSIVVFAGDRGNGPGIFASIALGNGKRQLITVAGENLKTHHPELGWTRLPNATGNPQGSPLYFSSFDINSRVAVWKEEPGALTAGHGFVVSFMGTPDAASAASPYEGVPFSASDGLWTEDVYAHQPLSGTGLAFSPNIAVPVVQQGDKIGGATVTSISVSDPLGGATKTRLGAARTATDGDHMAAFLASTSQGQMVVRATHFDLSVAQLRQIMPGLSLANAQRFINPLNVAMNEFGIVTPKRQAAFLAQLAVESSQLAKWTEAYTLKANFQLPGVNRPPHTATSAQDYFNYWYHDRVGNGSYSSNDGYNYRGRGPIQLTGRANYQRLTNALGIDLIHNPGLLSDNVNHPEIGFEASAFFFSTTHVTQGSLSGTLSQVADMVNVNSAQSIQAVNQAITKGVNGGTNGLSARLTYYKLALKVLAAS